MHGGDVTVQRQRLDERVVTLEIDLNNTNQVIQGRDAIGSSGYPAMSWKAKRDILIRGTNTPRRTVVIIATLHQPEVNIADQAQAEWLIEREYGNPLVGFDSGAGLFLRSSDQPYRALLWIESCFELLLCEFRSLYSRRPRNLQFELDLLEFFYPVSLIRNRRERLDRSLRTDQ